MGTLAVGRLAVEASSLGLRWDMATAVGFVAQLGKMRSVLETVIMAGCQRQESIVIVVRLEFRQSWDRNEVGVMSMFNRGDLGKGSYFPNGSPGSCLLPEANILLRKESLAVTLR